MSGWIDGLYDYGHLIGRICFALVFLQGGIAHFTNLGAVSGYAASKKLPAPKLLVIVSGVQLIVGSVLVMLGWRRFIGAGLLAIFALASALLVHRFWVETDPGARAMERVHFRKNLALAGGAVMIAYYAGQWWPLTVIGR